VGNKAVEKKERFRNCNLHSRIFFAQLRGVNDRQYTYDDNIIREKKRGIVDKKTQ